MIYFSTWEPYISAPNVMVWGGVAAISFGIYNLTMGDSKGGTAQIILGAIALIGSFFLR